MYNMELSQSTRFWRLFSFALLTVVTCSIVVVRGQVCQQSLPPQYVPEQDTQSTLPSNVGTVYLYPNAFRATQCLGVVTRLQYSFCYSRGSQSGGQPPAVFRVLLLENAANSYTVVNSYTEREDRACAQSCCKTVDVPLSTELSIQTDFALGIVIPGNAGSNLLYQATNERSMGFAVAVVNLGSIDITSVGSMISKPTLGQSQTINNHRFSLSFETEIPTTTMGPDIMTTTDQVTTTSSEVTTASTNVSDTTTTQSGSTTTNAEIVRNNGGAVAAGVIVTLLIIGGATTVVIVVVVILLKRRKEKSFSIQTTSPHHPNAFDNHVYESEGDVVKGRTMSSDNEGINDYSFTSSNKTDEVYEVMDGEQPYEIPIDASSHTVAQRSRGVTHPLPPASRTDLHGNHAGSFSGLSMGRNTLNPMTLVSKGRSDNVQYEEPIYEDPAGSEAELYEQYQHLNVTIIQRKEISTTDVLGKGHFGVVYRGEWTKLEGKTGVPVAVKTLKKGAKEEDKVKFLQEAAIIGQFSHPNVVKLHGIVTGEEKMIVLELLQGGDLHHALLALSQGSKGDTKLDTDLPHTLLSYCRQVASGMAYLSQKGFVHRDLAARNILLLEDCECKIADFGMTKDLAFTDVYVSHGGKVPVRWTAPEALHYKKYSTASDVWSFGCVMYEIWSLGKKPFSSYSNSECIRLISEGVRLPPPPGCPQTIYALMMDCWHPSASSRPDFVSVVQQLSLPDTKLLKWSEEDKAIDTEAATLGAGLEQSINLYKGMQDSYIHPHT